MTSAPFVLLDDQVSHRQLYFTDPVDVLTFRAGESLEAFFAAIEDAGRLGYWIAGSFAYEFGAVLEPALSSHQERGAELARIGIFETVSDHPPAHLLYRSSPPKVSLKPEWSEADYCRRFAKVQDYLKSGDAYQINLTFPMRGRMDGDAAALYAGYRRRQPGRYGGIVSLYGPEIVSFSPELFFEKRGRSMRMRPMKGTRPKSASDDMTLDEKSRAENLMIVDLLRNDLSRLSVPGSVAVPELFALEDYPTLVQMTSQVTSELRHDVGWQDIFAALFPCGSVTGAPKIRAMEIIRDLEDGPRGAYCGSIGYIAPNGDASFSVSIRTAVVDGQSIRYDVGSGVVLDSDGADEYRECLLKADMLRRPEETFFETLKLDPENGPIRGGRHAARLVSSSPNAAFWDVVKPMGAEGPMRLRVSANKDGVTTATTMAYDAIEQPVPLAVSRYALTRDVQRTDAKTSHRDFYDGERERISGVSAAREVLFVDAKGYLKEGSFTSLFVRKGDRLMTPAGPGLLPGVLRAELLETGVCKEEFLTLQDLLDADEVFVGNSLRGLMQAYLISEVPV